MLVYMLAYMLAYMLPYMRAYTMPYVLPYPASNNQTYTVYGTIYASAKFRNQVESMLRTEFIWHPLEAYFDLLGPLSLSKLRREDPYLRQIFVRSSSNLHRNFIGMLSKLR